MSILIKSFKILCGSESAKDCEDEMHYVLVLQV